MSRQILLTHNDIRNSVKGTEQFIEDYSAVKEDLSTVTVNNVYAGYGAIGIEAVTNIGLVDSTFSTITGYDTELITVPRNVTYRQDVNALSLDLKGVWEFNVRVSLTFNDENHGRQIQLRAFNLTTNTVDPNAFTFFVGRNQDGVNLAVVISLTVDNELINAGDLIQIQVGSVTDAFIGVDNIGTEYQVKHISEFQDVL